MDIDKAIRRYNKLASRRDERINRPALNEIAAKLAEQVPAGTRNDVDLLLGRTDAQLPERAEYGPQPAPSDYRIANRPDNPNWRGVAAWFDEAAGLRPTTDTTAATEAIAELAQAKMSEHDAYLESIMDQFGDWLDFERIRSDLAL